MKRVLKVILLIAIVIFLFDFVNAQKGCCSWHGGVSGCSSNGRIICNDGTYSPSCTCTPPKVYGCTDYNAINYDNNANIDNGSCRYEREEKETIILNYAEEIQNPNNIKNGKNKIIREGKNGEKIIKYRIVTDKTGNELSREIISETIVMEPIDKIILIEEAISQVINEKTEEQNKNISSQVYEDSKDSSILLLVLCMVFIFNKIKLKKRKYRVPFLEKIENINNRIIRYIFYFLYILFILPVTIDFIYLIFKINRMSK